MSDESDESRWVSLIGGEMMSMVLAVVLLAAQLAAGAAPRPHIVSIIGGGPLPFLSRCLVDRPHADH
jgi:hypothetical protein